MFARFLPDQFVMYGHIISDTASPLSSRYRYPNFREFEEFILWAFKNNYTFTRYSDFLSSTYKKQILLTFDDGLKSIFTELHPFMISQNIPYMVFINPGLQQNSVGMELMTLEDLLTLKKDNVSIGFHSNTHKRIEDTTTIDDPIFLSDVSVSQDVKAILTSPLAFAYPYSAPKTYNKYNTFLHQLGFEVIFGTGLPFESANNYIVRLPMDNYSCLELKNNVIMENLKSAAKQNCIRYVRNFLSNVKRKITF